MVADHKTSIAGQGGTERDVSDYFTVLGVKVNSVQIPDVVQEAKRWIEQRGNTHYIAVTGMHGVTEAQSDPVFKKILNEADLVVPDGMPLVWLGQWKGHALKRRVYGPEFMLTFCERTAREGYKHYFYGGAPGVAKELAESLTKRFPGLIVAGTYCPPFRALSNGERSEIIACINASCADVVWVGLSTPKQEKWMYEFREALNVPLLVGVGAAFDLNAGKVPQAPKWMQENGLEWCFRLWQEPRRLWRRYIVKGSQFGFYVILELLNLRKSD